MINFLDGSTQDCGISSKLVMDITVLHKAFDAVPSSYNMINFLDGSVHNCSNGVSEWVMKFNSLSQTWDIKFHVVIPIIDIIRLEISIPGKRVFVQKWDRGRERY